MPRQHSPLAPREAFQSLKQEPQPRPGKQSLAAQVAERVRPGAPLPPELREKMERAYGCDLSGVRVHQDDSSVPLGALAYTRGFDIFFAPGVYDPESRRGQEIIAHELAHVVQQALGRVAPTRERGGVPLNDDASLEAEAHELGRRAASGEDATHAPPTRAPLSAPSPAAPVQRLADAKVNEGKPLEIEKLTLEQANHYLAIAKGQKTDPDVHLDLGDDHKLLSRAQALTSGSLIRALLEHDMKAAVELVLQYGSYDALTSGKDEIKAAAQGRNPIDCGTTASLLRRIFFCGDVSAFQELYAVACRANTDELDKKTPLKPQSAHGMVAGTAGDLGSLLHVLAENVQPMLIQLDFQSKPKGLGHTYVVEVFARERPTDPLRGMVHQSYVEHYYLFEWLVDTKNKVLDPNDHLKLLQSICGGGVLELYSDVFLTSGLEKGFLQERKETKYEINCAFAARAFDYGAAASHLGELLSSKQNDIARTDEHFRRERKQFEQQGQLVEEKKKEPETGARQYGAMQVMTAFKCGTNNPRDIKVEKGEQLKAKTDDAVWECTDDGGESTAWNVRKWTFKKVSS
ncbi:MAG TPA: DUF4157 domain-containing protein [Polyangia bacterium]|nr:DUF4157 domain-containing protein [Polyangia bacterium]